jgi:hypothetical protein
MEPHFALDGSEGWATCHCIKIAENGLHLSPTEAGLGGCLHSIYPSMNDDYDVRTKVNC